jgi:TonB family protein
MRLACRQTWLSCAVAFIAATAGVCVFTPDAGAETVRASPRLTRAPKVLRFVEATYPETERATHRSATVVLRLTVTEIGSVKEVQVVTSASPAFDDAAGRAALLLTFEPAEVDGRPSAVRILFKYEFAPPLEKPKTALFVGVVRDRATYKPMPGVTVQVGKGPGGTTRLDGTFEIADVPPGVRSVTLSGGGLTPLLTQETFEAGQRLEVTYDVALPPPARAPSEADDIDIIVVAPPVQKQVVSTTVAAAQAVQLPGTQGDVLKVVESLPGVARSQVGSSALIVWGVAPQNTRTYVDGVPIPELYHVGGLRSVISTDLVRDVELVPGGYGAAHGNGLGGLVLVGMKPLENDGIHATVAADLFQASGAFRASIGDKLRFAVAGEISYVDQLAGGLVSPEVQEFFPFPRYHDAQARLHYQLNARESLDLVGLYSGDLASSGVPNQDPTLSTLQTTSMSFYRLYLRYENQLASGVTVSVTPYAGVDQSLLTDKVGSIATDVRNSTTLGGVRAAWHGVVATWLSAEAGFDAEVQSSSVQRLGSLEQPPRNGDPYVFGEPPPAQLTGDSWNVLNVNLAPYAELDFAPLPQLHLTPGLRFDPYARLVSRSSPTGAGIPPTGLSEQNVALEPRIAGRWEINERFGLRAAFGQYHQNPAPEDLSAIFGNPALPTSTAQHTLAGVTVHLTKTLLTELTGFYNQSQQLAVRSTAPTPAVAEALLPAGSGRAYGGQILLRQELWHGFFGWVSYTLSRSEIQETRGGPWLLSNYDQTHLLTLAAAYDFGGGWNIGLRFRYATGFPRTPVTGAYEDIALGIYEPTFGAVNSIRIPAFVQLDLRASKEWKIGPTHLEVSLDVQNVTDQANPEEIVYSSDFSRMAYITGLPIMPVLGVRWSL